MVIKLQFKTGKYKALTLIIPVVFFLFNCFSRKLFISVSLNLPPFSISLKTKQHELLLQVVQNKVLHDELIAMDDTDYESIDCGQLQKVTIPRVAVTLQGPKYYIYFITVSYI